MNLPMFQVDAFTSRRFCGNPAAVVLLETWLSDDILQAIAAENNLSETAFIRPEGGAFGLRWFTPEVEVDLCGHATLAGAFVLFEEGLVEGDSVGFESRSGRLTVARDGDLLTLDFPARPPAPAECTDDVVMALGDRPREVLVARDLLAVFETEDEVVSLQPDFDGIEALDAMAVIATAPGREVDFVSRFFAPGVGVPEDPVTGSAHCTLVPYWSERLGKRNLHARQVSKRGGELLCEDRGDRVAIGGRAVMYLRGAISI